MELESELLAFSNQFSLSHKDLILQLLNIDGVGRATIKKILFSLIKTELTAKQFWVQKNAVLQKVNISNKVAKKIKKEKKEHKNYSNCKQLEKAGIRVVGFWEEEYPKLLKQSSDFPVLLFVKGNISALSNRFVGVVGTRRITSYGRLATKKVVSDLVLEDFSVVSGFMYGVDLCAHLETMNSGGVTVAVLGFGFNHMFPKSNKKYVQKVLDSGGCFISEYLPDIEPATGNFPQRNRIIAGMSEAVVVVEAAQKSGSHITATCALNEGRDVFAVPGPIYNPFSEGTKWLVNQGAALISSGFDVVAELKNYSKISDRGKLEDLTNLNKLQQAILSELKSGVTNIDDLVEILKKNAAVISAELSLLELNEIVKIENDQIYLSL